MIQTKTDVVVVLTALLLIAALVVAYKFGNEVHELAMLGVTSVWIIGMVVKIYVIRP